MSSKPRSKETLGLVKAALAEPTPEEAARKLALVKRLESDIDFRHAIEKRNQVAEEAQNELPGMALVRADALLRKVDAAGEGAEAHDTIRDVAGMPASKEARDALEKSRTQPGLQPPPIKAGVEDVPSADTEAPAADEMAPGSPESRSTSRWLIWLGLLALVAVGVVIWIVVGRLTTTENAGVPSAKPVDTSARSQTATANTTPTSVDPVRTVGPVKTADPVSTVVPSSTPSGPRPTATTSTATTSTLQTSRPPALPHQTSSAPFKWNWP